MPWQGFWQLGRQTILNIMVERTQHSNHCLHLPLSPRKHSNTSCQEQFERRARYIHQERSRRKHHLEPGISKWSRDMLKGDFLDSSDWGGERSIMATSAVRQVRGLTAPGRNILKQNTLLPVTSLASKTQKGCVVVWLLRCV